MFSSWKDNMFCCAACAHSVNVIAVKTKTTWAMVICRMYIIDLKWVDARVRDKCCCPRSFVTNDDVNISPRSCLSMGIGAKSRQDSNSLYGIWCQGESCTKLKKECRRKGYESHELEDAESWTIASIPTVTADVLQLSPYRSGAYILDHLL